jgi:hypothetical protein
MRHRVLCLALDSLSIEREELNDALETLVASGTVLSYRHQIKTISIEFDPVKAEMVLELFKQKENDE